MIRSLQIQIIQVLGNFVEREWKRNRIYHASRVDHPTETTEASVLINGRLFICSVITEKHQKASNLPEWLDSRKSRGKNNING